jgi:hypothetical protein
MRSYFCVLLICLVTGCISLRPSVGASSVGRISRATVLSLREGMTTTEARQVCGAPATERKPTKQELHSMFPGGEWDTAWLYHARLGDRYVPSSCAVTFAADTLVFWTFPFLTKTEYLSLVEGVRTKSIVEMDDVRAMLGAPASSERVGAMTVGRYHLAQVDGTWYPGAIEVWYLGNRVSSVTLANLR